MEDNTHQRHAHGTMPVPEALSKLVPLRSRTDSDRDHASQRSRIRNALPGTNPLRIQSGNKSKHGHSHRQAAKETVQSALELRPPINFDHLLRRDKRSQPSRTNSNNDVNGKTEELTLAQQSTQALKESVDANDVRKLSEQNAKREEELRSALKQVEDQSMQSTRRLDDTYYLLLEKGESLRQIVRNMQDLARESQRQQEDFNARTQELQQGTHSGIDNFANFSQQEDDINGLLQRLGQFKDRTSKLNDRLETARQRTDACERRVLKAQATRRKRWSIVWATLLAAVVLVLAAVLYRRTPNASGNSFDSASQAVSAAISPALRRLRPSPSEDPYLQSMFSGIS